MVGEGDEATATFIERMGISLQEDGWPRIAGRMLAFFVAHGGPFSFTEIAERLRVSRASVSTNARLLRGMGLIERVGRAGDRQDYYRLAEDPYAGLLDGYIARMRHRREVVDQARDRLPATAGESRRRIAALGQFYEAAIESTEALGERLRAPADLPPRASAAPPRSGRR
jgi:DNA-binding transcriptional regulator GbsR (MarR family)